NRTTRASILSPRGEHHAADRTCRYRFRACLRPLRTSLLGHHFLVRHSAKLASGSPSLRYAPEPREKPLFGLAATLLLQHPSFDPPLRGPGLSSWTARKRPYLGFLDCTAIVHGDFPHGCLHEAHAPPPPEG